MKATTAPGLGAEATPFWARVAASQYTKAGEMLKIVPMIMKNQRPTMAWRIWSTARRRLRSRNRTIEVCCWPNVLDRRMPLTLSVSSVVADRSASDFWVSVETVRRTLPTRKVRYRKNGVIASERRVSCQLEDEHRDDRADGHGQVAGEVRRRVGHHGLDPADVVGQPALDLAGPGVGEEAQGHPLEMGVQGVAQVLHDVLADDVVEVA